MRGSRPLKSAPSVLVVLLDDAGFGAYADIGFGLSGILLWPVVLIHGAMAAWCVVRLLDKPAQIVGTGQPS